VPVCHITLDFRFLSNSWTNFLELYDDLCSRFYRLNCHQTQQEQHSSEVSLQSTEAKCSLKNCWQKNRINNNHNDKYKWSQIFDERLHPKNFPFPKGIWASTSYKYMVPWGHLVHIPNSVSIGLSVLAQLKLMSTDRHTSRNIGIYCTGRISALCACDVA